MDLDLIGEIKRKVRRLKKLEISIRFGGDEKAARGRGLVWDAFFDLGGGSRRAKYTLASLARMSREEYRRVAEEFLTLVYCRYFRDTGEIDIRIYDPEILSRLGLPYDADLAAVKKRFRELAKKYHPDAGGDPEDFIALAEDYRELVEKGE